MFTINTLNYQYPSKDNDFTLCINNLDFESNQIVALIGANGCGKSTFYRLLSGVLQSANMSITYHEQKYSSLLDTNLKIGFHNAFAALIDTLTVRQNLKLFARIYCVNNIENEIEKVASQFEVTQLLNHYPNKLSQGQQHRVKLCRTMLQDPDIILFDEPTIASDIKQIESILSSISTIKSQGKLVFFSTHHLYEITKLKPRLIGMKAGQIAFDTPWSDKFHERDQLSNAMYGIMKEEKHCEHV